MAVTRALDQASPEPRDGFLRECIVIAQEFPPVLVANPGCVLRGAGDVGDQNRRQYPIGLWR
jgi:hypothetical protein